MVENEKINEWKEMMVRITIEGGIENLMDINIYFIYILYECEYFLDFVY